MVGPEAVTKAENSGRSVGDYTATDPEGEDVTWTTLTGADAGHFAFDNGALSFVSEPDYEARPDNTYEVTVRARDEGGKTGELRVTVTVVAVDEAPDISFVATGGVTVNDNALTVDESYDGTLATFTASDPERKPGLTYEWSVVGTDRGDFAITAAGRLSFAAIPDHEHPADSGGNNVYDIRVKALDSDGETGRLPVTVTVRDVNEAPEFPSTEDGMRSVPENTPAGRDVGAPVAAVAGDNDTLTYSITSGAALFGINTATGQLLTKASLDREAAVSHHIAVGVSDGKDANNVAEDPPVVDNRISVTITVDDVDEAPKVMGPEAVTKAENSGRSVGDYTANDPEGGDVTWTTLTGADAGHFAFDNGALSFVSEPDYEARPDNTYEVTVRARDEGGKTGELRVTVTITPVNEPPTITGDASIDYAENGTGRVGSYRARDPEGEDVTWLSLTGDDTGFFLFSNSGELTFRNAPDFEARLDNTYEVTVRARDEGGETGELRVTVTVRDVNEAPEFPSTEDGMRSVPENTPAGRNVGAPVAAVAGDKDTLTYSITSGANLFDINTATGQLLTKALLDREAAVSHTITVGVSDGKDARNMAEDPPVVDDTIFVEIAVDDVDEAPKVVGPEAVTKAENSGRSVGAYTATDPEGEDVTWTTLTGADAGHFAFDNGALSFVSEPDFEARPDNTYEVTVRARDEGGKTGELRVTVTITPVNERPTITGDATRSLAEAGTLLVGTYGATDPESATIAWLPLGGADKDEFEFTPSNGRLAFETAPDFEDTARNGDNVYEVTLSVSAGGHTVTFNVTVTVTNQEEPGLLALPNTQPQADADYTATLSDLDGVQSTTWTWERSTSRNGPWTPVSGSVNRTTTSVYTPVTGDVGYYLQITAAYTDGHGPNKSRVRVSANAVKAATVDNEPPSFDEPTPTRSIAENAGARAAVGRPVTATDPNSGDVLTYELSGSDLFTIDSNNGQIRVAADESLDHETAPSHRVTVTASDSSTASDTVTVTITVTNVNEPPTAEGDRADTREDAAVIIYVLDNDSDPEDDRSELLLTVFNSGPNAPRNGTVTVNEPANAGEHRTITYAPHADYNGADSFEYRVRDTGTGGLTDTALVAIDVTAVNDAPAFPESMPARSVSESAEAGDNVGAPVTATDVDENDTLTYSLYGVDASSFEIDSKGQITVATFDIAAQETYTVTVDADDGSNEINAIASVEVTITVTARQVGPPIFTGGGVSFGGGGGGGGPSPSVIDFEWT